MSIKAAIKAIHSYLPEKKLTNEQLAQEYREWDVAKIYSKTGISVRGLADENECSSDLGVAAAKRLFEQEDVEPADIDFLIFCTQTPDYFLPSTGCIVQHRLGLSTDCGATDINLGCSGFVYGLALAKGLIESNCAKNVLLITAETYSKFINPKDRSVRTLFGDGAAATWITAVESTEELIGPFIFGTDGSGATNLIIPAGACRKAITNETGIEKDDGSGNVRSEQNLYMNGPEIFKFSLETVPAAFHQLLDKAKRKAEDIDYYILHQANKFMLEHLRRRMKVPEAKFCINLESYGNTVSSTIPMALELAKKEQEVSCGDTVMLLGFGVGYSWSATLIKII